MNFKQSFIKSILILTVFGTAHAQQGFVSPPALPDSIYYRQLPEYPDAYTTENVTARLIEGLAFRYYWASEGLRSTDLNYKPGPNTRTTEETIDHIMGLSRIINNAIIGKENTQTGEETNKMDFITKRNLTLEYLRNASESLRYKKVQLQDLKIIFINKEGKKTEYPFWNAINGPISDALWHIGQVVSFRRSSGNPFNNKVRLLTGKVSN